MIFLMNPVVCMHVYTRASCVLRVAGMRWHVCAWSVRQRSAELREYVEANNQWMGEQIAQHGTQDAHDEDAAWWHQVSLMLGQQQGLFEGYTAYAGTGHAISAELMLTLSMHSDMDTLCDLFGGT